MGSYDYFPPIKVYELAPGLLEQTLRILQLEGWGETESLLFWAGRVSGDHAQVTDIIVPKGEGVEKHRLYVRLSEEAMVKVAELIDPPSRILLAQVHTHGGKAFHSATDDFYGFRSPGFISVVIENNAVAVSPRIEGWAVFECIDGDGFRSLPPVEIKSRFRPNPGLLLSVAEVGDG